MFEYLTFSIILFLIQMVQAKLKCTITITFCTIWKMYTTTTVSVIIVKEFEYDFYICALIKRPMIYFIQFEGSQDAYYGEQ